MDNSLRKVVNWLIESTENGSKRDRGEFWRKMVDRMVEVASKIN